ncbi:MAG: hypothetical protein KIS91_06955 [Anaerolineae bacterium]|nr:hypothetical protein [Anaerolineae bacterium]
MMATQNPENIHQVRMLRKDVGVALVTAIALLLGWLLGQQVLSRSQTFQAQDTPFRMAFPYRWTQADTFQDVVVKMENPLTDSTYKTNVTVETRLLDPQNAPTLQTLLDRRVEQRQGLTAYHYLSDRDAAVDAEKAKEFQYAYAVQPIDEARRQSLPVVVQAREIIIVTQDRSYYITLAAPADSFAAASAQFDQMLATAKVK